jgi:site-specific DNA-methyltransferase (adenine-specific)
MNQGWDATGIAFDVDLWREVFRVLKPGAHGAVFGADRKMHRVISALEDAGFEVRATGAWVSAQVFPKSLDAMKAMEAKGMAGAEKWRGWGTALKTLEPWVLVRKPMEGTLAENLTKWGVGALNIDGCRLPNAMVRPLRVRGPGGLDRSGGVYSAADDGSLSLGSRAAGDTDVGRWPSLLVCSDLDLEGPVAGVEVFGAEDDDLDGVLGPYTKHFRIGDQVLASVPDDLFARLLPTLVVCPKVGPAERELGCDEMEEAWVDPSRKEGSAGRDNPRAGAGRKAKRKNIHPTVKPISLMRHIIRMVTPPGGTVLDTFAGSAAGGMAAVWEGMSYIGMELTDTDEQPFLRIGRARLDYAKRTPAPPIEARVVKPKEVEENPQLSLF